MRSFVNCPFRPANGRFRSGSQISRFPELASAPLTSPSGACHWVPCARKQVNGLREHWLNQEAKAEDLGPLLAQGLSAQHRRQLGEGESLRLQDFSDSEQEALNHFGLLPARVGWTRTALKILAGALQVGKLQVLLVEEANREPTVFVRAGSGGPWRRYSGAQDRLPTPVFAQDRQRRFGFLLQEYGDENTIPPRWVFGPRSNPRKLDVPRFVAGSAQPARPSATIYGRQLGQARLNPS